MKSPSSEGRDVAVLVVDDHAPFREVLRTVVGRVAGFTVVGEASSGEAAADAVALLSPEMVLMDVMMPGIGGIAAARSILSENPATLVVLISADDARLRAGAASLGEGIPWVRKQDLLPARVAELWRTHRG